MAELATVRIVILQAQHTQHDVKGRHTPPLHSNTGSDSTQYWVNIGPIPIHARCLGPVFLILVQQQHKTGRPMFGSMLAGQSFASIPDLGPAVAKDWRPVYRFMLAGRSFASIPDLGPAVAHDCRPMY